VLLGELGPARDAGATKEAVKTELELPHHFVSTTSTVRPEMRASARASRPATAAPVFVTAVFAAGEPAAALSQRRMCGW
jgi:hypothetical protein